MLILKLLLACTNQFERNQIQIQLCFRPDHRLCQRTKIAPFGSGNEMANALCMWQTSYYVWIYGTGWQRIPITDWEKKSMTCWCKRKDFCALTKKPSSSGWLVVHGQLIQSLGWLTQHQEVNNEMTRFKCHDSLSIK